jgi:hypothetical protein
MHSPTQLVTELLDAMNTRQLDRIRRLVTDDFIDHGPPVALPPGPDVLYQVDALTPPAIPMPE